MTFNILSCAFGYSIIAYDLAENKWKLSEDVGKINASEIAHSTKIIIMYIT